MSAVLLAGPAWSGRALTLAQGEVPVPVDLRLFLPALLWGAETTLPKEVPVTLRTTMRHSRSILGRTDIAMTSAIPEGARSSQ